MVVSSVVFIICIGQRCIHGVKLLDPPAIIDIPSGDGARVLQEVMVSTRSA
jgi:hypothetical protein